jgi:uracil-DNA glycosylase
MPESKSDTETSSDAERSAQDSLPALARAVADHIRTLQEFGLTHIGNAAPSIDRSVAAISPPPSDASAAKAPAPDPPPLPPPQPVIAQPPSPMTKPPSTRKAAAQTSLFLFGEPAPPSAAEPDHQDGNLHDIRADIGDCQRCKLAPTRTHIVFGDGNPNAQLVFVGEAPGADEDASGVPFVGRAGQLLNKIIEAIGMKREDVYIANVVKCRPPENRTPEKDEIAACSGFLHRQLALIRPKIIVALGAPAAFTLLNDGKIGSITKIRGQIFDYRGVPLMPTFHPAYLLRSPDKKREVWEDMKKVRDLLKG